MEWQDWGTIWHRFILRFETLYINSIGLPRSCFNIRMVNRLEIGRLAVEHKLVRETIK